MYNFDDQFTLRPTIENNDGRSNSFNKYKPVDFKEFMDALIPAIKIRENIERHLTRTTQEKNIKIHGPPTMITFADYFKRYPHFEEHFIETLKLICKKYTIISNNTKVTAFMNFHSESTKPKIDLKTYLRNQLRGMYQRIDIYNEHSSPMLNTQVYCPLVEKLSELDDKDEGIYISAQVSPSISIPNALSNVHFVNEANNYGSLEQKLSDSIDNEESESEIVEMRQTETEKIRNSKSFGEARQLDFGDTTTPIIDDKNWTKPEDILHENDMITPPSIIANITVIPVTVEVKNDTTIEVKNDTIVEAENYNTTVENKTTERVTIKKPVRRPPSEAAKATVAFLRSLGNHGNVTRKSPIIMRPFSIMTKHSSIRNRTALFNIKRPNILKKNYTIPANTSADVESRVLEDDSMTIDESEYDESVETVASGSESLDIITENTSKEKNNAMLSTIPEIYENLKNTTKTYTNSNDHTLNVTSILETYIEVPKEETVNTIRTENKVETVSEKVSLEKSDLIDETLKNEEELEAKQVENITIENGSSTIKCLKCYAKFNITKSSEVKNVGENKDNIPNDFVRIGNITKPTEISKTNKINSNHSQINNISTTTKNIVLSTIINNNDEIKENIEGRNIIKNTTEYKNNVTNETLITLFDVDFPTSNIEKGYDRISPSYTDLLPKDEKINMTTYKAIISKLVNETITKNNFIIAKQMDSKNITENKNISNSEKKTDSSMKFESIIESRENPDIFLTNETNKMDTIKIINETNGPIKTNKNIANVSIAKTPSFSQMLPFNKTNEFRENSKKFGNNSDSGSKNTTLQNIMGIPLLMSIFKVMNETKSSFITDSEMYTMQNFTSLLETENNSTSKKFNESLLVSEEINTTTVRIDSLTFEPESRRLEVIEVTTKQTIYLKNNQTEKSIGNTTFITDHTENPVKNTTHLY